MKWYWVIKIFFYKRFIYSDLDSESFVDQLFHHQWNQHFSASTFVDNTIAAWLRVRIVKQKWLRLTSAALKISLIVPISSSSRRRAVHTVVEATWRVETVVVFVVKLDLERYFDDFSYSITNFYFYKNMRQSTFVNQVFPQNKPYPHVPAQIDGHTRKLPSHTCPAHLHIYSFQVRRQFPRI